MILVYGPAIGPMKLIEPMLAPDQTGKGRVRPPPSQDLEPARCRAAPPAAHPLAGTGTRCRPPTVVLAYERLAAEGYVRGRTGSGTYVSTDLPDQAPAPPPRRPCRRALSARGAGCSGSGGGTRAIRAGHAAGRRPAGPRSVPRQGLGALRARVLKPLRASYPAIRRRKACWCCANRLPHIWPRRAGWSPTRAASS